MKTNSNFTAKLTAISDKTSNNLYLQSISQGVMSMLPVIIIGAFASLFSGLPINFWQSFIQSTGLTTALTMVINATTNMLGVYFTYGIARTFAEKQGLNSKLSGILAVVTYFILLPSYSSNELGSYLSFDYTGTKGMIVGIIVALLSVKFLKTIIDKNITIKMPENTPDYVSKSFASLIPGMLLVVATIVVRMIFSVTSYGSIFECLYGILQLPMQALLGGSVISNVIVQLLTQVCWSLGIHPGFLSSITAPVLFALDGANQAAYAAGQTVPNTIGMAMSYSTTIACFYPAIAICVLLFAKSKELKTVGKVSIAPALFGISEPMIFGLPIMLNPLMIIPWIICPVVNFVVAYAACSLGIVAKYAGVTVFNFPMIATGLLNGSFSIVILEIILFTLDIIIFLPFIKALDKKKLESEQAD